MTVLEKAIKDILMKYGFHRHCICYREKCLVLPESMINLSVETIARQMGSLTKYILPVSTEDEIERIEP